VRPGGAAAVLRPGQRADAGRISARAINGREPAGRGRIAEHGLGALYVCGAGRVVGGAWLLTP